MSELCVFNPLRKTEGAGNAGCTPHPLPRVQTKETHAGQHRYAEIIRHSLRNGFTAAPCSSWCAGLFSHHRPGLLTRGLTPAAGSRNHTACPYAPCRTSCGTNASIATRLTSGDEWPSRPPCRGGLASLNHKFCLSEIGIFLRDALYSSGKTGGGV